MIKGSKVIVYSKDVAIDTYITYERLWHNLNIPFLLLTILIALWLQYEIAKSKKQDKRSNQHFWQRERKANTVRRRDISNLNYIHVAVDRLPLKNHEDDTINSYRDTIIQLADKKILNLTGLTNTELKYQYGTANLALLSEYDNNYTKLVSILHKWGCRLYDCGNISDAVLVLEYAISCFTDVTQTYRLLATIYKEKEMPHHINHLVEIISDTKILRKDTLIKELKQIKNS